MLIMLFACKSDKNEDKYLNYNRTYNERNINTQLFYIDNSIDNIVKGQNGTKLIIPKNSFQSINDSLDQKNIRIELKEITQKSDFVIGNFSTITENREFLETGGMIYLQAYSNGEELILKNGSSIKVAIPTDSLLNGMSIFEGERNSNGQMIWNNPIQIGQGEDSIPQILEFEKSHNIRYTVEPFGGDSTRYPQKVMSEVGRIAWRGTGLKISKDSTLIIGGHIVNFIKQDTLTKWSQVFEVEKGNNNYLSDQNINYIFELKNLGWANIDRLLKDLRTTDVKLIVSIPEENKFNYVFTNLITERMYLPGYQKKDNTFSFTHGDFETTKLPVGENAMIIATAYKGGEVYFGFEKFEISKVNNVDVQLKKVNENEIKEILEKEI